MRRFALLFLAACSSPPKPMGLTPEESQMKRDACEFKAGALTTETLPPAPAIPIEHIVLIMQENRSFDHYFGKLTHGGVTVAPEGVTNPDPTGAMVSRFHLDTYCVEDTSHGWNPSHRQFNDGKNDGFVTSNSPLGERAMGYYDETDLPVYYALARTFAISDAHFASVMGPTQPNRLYYYAATSFGTIANTIPPLNDARGRPYPNMFTRLDQAQVKWKVYSTNVASPAVFLAVLAEHFDDFVRVDQFHADAMAGTLPPVSIVEAAYGLGVKGDEDDEHAPANVQLGQRFVASIVKSVMESPLWPKTALIFSYDEHGGYYDHVPPGKACIPDAIEPIGDSSRHFDHLGFRVPLIVVSPYARRGYVSHVVSDHSSVFRFMSVKWGLKALTARDANADALLDLFDFEHPDTSVPQLPEAVIDQAKRDRCYRDFP
jgi:phospholipase C